jgi:capsular polysaccharide transport system permease protein
MSVAPNIVAGLGVQRRVVGALILRELHTRYGRENIGYLWLILEPLLLATAIAFIHSRAPNHFGTDMKPVPFTVLGYCNFMMFRSMFNRAEGALEGNLTLLYHRQVTILDVMLARGLLEAAGTTFAFALLMGVALATGMADPPERPAILMLGLVLLFLLSLGLSFCVAAATHDNRSIGRLVHPIGYVMLPLSGCFVALQWLPAGLRSAFEWVPLTHVFEILRHGWFRSARADYIDWAYLIAWVMGSLLIGLLALSTLRRRIHMP